MSRLYHDGNRALQDRFDTRRLADRIEERLDRDTFDEGDRAFVERMTMFFLATADEDGTPQCSYKGGDPGFVRVVDEHTLAFPSYDGNGTYLSLGNLLRNPRVGLLFVDFESPSRLRVNGLGVDRRRRPAARVVPGGAARRPRARHPRAAELPPLRPPHGDGGAVALRAARGVRDAGAGLEAPGMVARRAARRRPRARCRPVGLTRRWRHFILTSIDLFATMHIEKVRCMIRVTKEER